MSHTFSFRTRMPVFYIRKLDDVTETKPVKIFGLAPYIYIYMK